MNKYRYMLLISMISTILLSGCVNNKEVVDKKEEVKNDELYEELKDDLNNGSNSSITGNTLNESDDVKLEKLRLRIISVHYQLIYSLLSVAPNVNEDFAKTNQSIFVNEGSDLLMEGKIIKDLLTDIEEYDIKLTEEEKELNNNLINLLEEMIVFLENTINMFESVETEDGNVVLFNEKDYKLSDYMNYYNSYKEKLDETMMDYALYSSNFLLKDEVDMTITEADFNKLILYEKYLYDNNSTLIDEANKLIENKYKYGNDYSLIYKEINSLLEKENNTELKVFEDYFILINKINKEKDTNQLIIYLKELVVLTESFNFIKFDNYLTEDIDYLYNYISYYLIL